MSKRWFPFAKGRDRAAPATPVAPLFPARVAEAEPSPETSPAPLPAPSSLASSPGGKPGANPGANSGANSGASSGASFAPIFAPRAAPDQPVIATLPALAGENRDGEFILAGHSHIWAMGAPLGYKGPRGVIPGEAFGRRGHYFVEQDGNGPADNYWDDFIGHARGRDAIIVWNGNQYWHCLLQQAPPFDFVDRWTPDLDSGAHLVPRRLVEAWFEPTVSPLRGVLQRLRQAGVHSVTTVGTPPPPLEMQRFETVLRQSAHFRAIAANQGVDIGDVRFTSSAILLKLWRVVQDLVAAATADAACRFVAVPDWLCDEWGHLSPDYQFAHDCTHATPSFGQAMLKLSLHAEGAPDGSPV